MSKDYYLILGVPLDAVPDEIRSAFRKLALRYHPDRGRESGAGAFQTISEAYDVLSDPDQRARYDQQRRGRPTRVEHTPITVRAREPEPLISKPVTLSGRDEAVRPSFDALLDRLGANLLGLDPPKAERPEPLGFELIVSPEEAGRGVSIPFEVPVFSICFQCGGTGRDWLFPCGDCGGDGRIVGREALQVDIPAGVRDGTCIERSLDGVGVRNLWLRVRVRVARH